MTGEVEARLQELVRAGLARPPLRKLPEDFWKLPRPEDHAGRSLTVLIEERGGHSEDLVASFDGRLRESARREGFRPLPE